MTGLTDQSSQSMDPNLSTGARGNKYPNPFFDLAQQYMPPTIKELFRWCTFYYYNSPLIGSAITKISQYPITDLIFEHHNPKVRSVWENIFNKDLQIKSRLLEINLDYNVYGNAFISVHLPFTRFLECAGCKHREPIKQANWSFNTSGYEYMLTCKRCSHSAAVKAVLDTPYKDKRGIRIIRWNPENIQVKYNEYTGRAMYMYSVPYKLRNAIQRGDKDILEDIPQIVVEALKNRRLIRFNEENFKHLKRPTLAEQDQGWGKPRILHVMKDMFYFYTLRRAQEAIALEHIVPFDIIYPMPNAQQDPYIHTDLANWRVQIESIIGKHRRDPNFKGVIPIPVGFGRLGGDGKAMMLGPELTYLTQTIVGGMGIPQEFLFGGLNWTGSSVSLRTLENDFIQNRTQLLDTCEWLKEKCRIWLNLPDLESMRFSDFRMADDIQRNQQLIGLNAQGKVSDETLLTELGYNYDHEVKKIITEIHLQNYIQELRSKAGAKAQGEAQVIGFNYQQKIQEIAQKAQEEAQKRFGEATAAGDTTAINPSTGQPDPQMQPGQEQLGQPNWQSAMPQPLDPSQAGQGNAQLPMPQPGQDQGQVPGQEVDMEMQGQVKKWAVRIMKMPPEEAKGIIAELKQKVPEVGIEVEKEYNSRKGQVGGAETIDMSQKSEKAAPRKQGSV